MLVTEGPGYWQATEGDTSSQRPPAAIPARKHVALLQGDAFEAALVRDWLVAAGHLCSWYECGYAFMRAMPPVTFDLIIVDWNVRNVTGEAVLRHMRARLQSQIPVIFLSAFDQEAAVVAAFKQGADDYMVKPVRRRELLARLEAITRRTLREMHLQSSVIDNGSLRVDCEGRIAWRAGQSITLTAKDFDLAVLFLSNVGQLLTRQQIHDAIWERGTVMHSRTLDTYVGRIRTRLGLEPQHGWRLAAVYGQGYRLDQVALPPVKSPARRGTHDVYSYAA